MPKQIDSYFSFGGLEHDRKIREQPVKNPAEQISEENAKAKDQLPIEKDNLTIQPRESASEYSAEKILDEIDRKILDMEKTGDLINTTEARKFVEENLYVGRDNPNLLRLNFVEKAINKIYFGKHLSWKAFAKDRKDAIRGVDKEKEYSSAARFYRIYFEGEVWSGQEGGYGQDLGFKEEALHQNSIDFERGDERTWTSSPVGYDSYGAVTAGNFPTWLDKSIITPPNGCGHEKDTNPSYTTEIFRYEAHLSNLSLNCRVILTFQFHNNGRYHFLELAFHSKEDADKFGHFLWQQRLDEHRQESATSGTKKTKKKNGAKQETILVQNHDAKTAETLLQEIKAMPGSAEPEPDILMQALEDSLETQNE